MLRPHIEHAMMLLARQDSGDRARAQSAQAELSAWRGQATLHEQAYQEALRRWQAVEGMRHDLRQLVPEPPRRAAPRLWSGWAPRLSMALAVLACVGLGWYYAIPIERHDFTTGVGQVARFDLGDRSLIELNGGTQLQVRYYRNRRDVRVLQGEARFHVQNLAGLPFRVHAGDVSATVVGTVFSVARRDQGARVQVEEGAVDVAVDGPWWKTGGASALLRAGQQVAAVGDMLVPLPAISEQATAPWTRGLFVFDDTPLSEVAAQLGGWFDRPLQVADAAAGAQRITGTFHLNDVRGLLDLLPRIASVRVWQQDGAVVIGSAAR